MAKTPKGGMGVQPVNHAQDARAIAKLSHRFKKYLLEPALPAVLDSIWLWLLLYDPKRLADVARHRMAAQLHTLKRVADQIAPRLIFRLRASVSRSRVAPRL